MPHALRAALLVCLCLPVPARALTLSFTGVIESVIDGSNFLDGSVTPNAPVSGTYQVDLTTADTSSPFGVGAGHLVIAIGDYTFDAAQDPDTIALIDNRNTGIPGVTVDVWQSGALVDSELSPPSNSSGSFGGYVAQIEFYDFDSSVFDGSETAPIDPLDPAVYPNWEQVRVTLNSVNGSLNPDGRVVVQLAIPEPRSGALLAVGVAALARRRRRS
jgi:hypothetical protein